MAAIVFNREIHGIRNGQIAQNLNQNFSPKYTKCFGCILREYVQVLDTMYKTDFEIIQEQKLWFEFRTVFNREIHGIRNDQIAQNLNHNFSPKYTKRFGCILREYVQVLDTM